MRRFIVIPVLLIAAYALAETKQSPSTTATTPNEQPAPALIPVAAIGSKSLILGDLGLPIGETITISGEKKANGPLADYFWVDTINGKKMEGVRGIQIEGIAHWREGTRATIRGYEFGMIRFLSIEDGNAGPSRAKFKPRQHIFLSFRVEKVIEPATLELKKE